MNTVMEEKIKQAFQEWKEQPKQEESDMKQMNKQQTLSNMLLQEIESNPGVTGKQLRVYISEQNPEMPPSYVPATLKGLYDKHFVSRIAVPSEDGNRSRATYAYTKTSDKDREALAKFPKSKPKFKKVKKVKVSAPINRPNAGINTLIPVERVATNPLAVGATTLYITIRTGEDASYSLRLDEAKSIYQQLHQIFGGMR